MIDTVDYHGFKKTQYRSLDGPEIERFNDDEIELLDEVIEFVCFQNSAKTISEFSHQRPWESVEFGDIIPYESAFMLLPSQVTPEAYERVEQGAAEIEKARSNADAMDFGTLAAFRSRVLSSLGKL